MTTPRFYKRLDWYLCSIGGGCSGWGISHYFTGSAVVASLVLILGIVLFIAGIFAIHRRYR